MKKTHVLIIFAVLCILLSLSCVSASNNITEVTISNETSIQETINSIDNNGVINLNPGTYHQNNIIINKNLTIQGNGNAEEIIINGDNKWGGIFNTNSTITVIIKNITFINGYNKYGGAINGEGGSSIIIENSIFKNNTANNKNGGAVAVSGTRQWQPGGYINYDGYLKIDNPIFLNNSAGHDGGAVCIYQSKAEIINSIFKYNYAERDGGALRVGILSDAYVANCIFENNRAKEWGGALYNWPGKLTVHNSTLNNNSAGEKGGAIITSGPLTVINSIITNNRADTGDGGAIYVSEETYQIPSTVIINNNEIYNNTAYGKGLDIYIDYTTATDSNFENNYWGNNNPLNDTNTSWSDRFNTNHYFNNPSTWITKHTTNPEPSIPINPNKTDTENNEKNNITNQTHSNPITTIENMLVTAIVSTGYLQETNSSSQYLNIEDSPINDKTVKKIIKKEDADKTTDKNYTVYLITIIVAIAILAYGYLRYNRKQ